MTVDRGITMDYYVITIGREYGSGGGLIGKKLADELGIPFYDKEIISLAAQQSGLAESIIEQNENKKTNSLLYSLYMTNMELPVTDQIFLAQSQVIKDVAKQGPCVIVGRCADYILRDNSRCIRVFIHAPLEERVKRLGERLEWSDKKLEAVVKKEDKNRSSYYNHFTQNRWGQASNYHLCINSSIGVDKAVAAILALVKD